MPEVIESKPEPDFWGRMCKARPESAIAEIVWNALDADAASVNVTVSVNEIDGIEYIEITDDGTGFVPNGTEHDFKHLGGSWKAAAGKTRKFGRMLHGKNGQGRFRAFSLGSKVVWDTTYEIDGAFLSYTISGDTIAPGKFTLGDARKNETTRTGTSVKVFNVDEGAHRLRQPETFQSLARVFAPYLVQYRNVKLNIDNNLIDTNELVRSRREFPLGPLKLSNGTEIDAKLEVIEWKSIIGRGLYLCNEDGFAYAERPAEVRAPGFHFGAYLKSSVFRELNDSNLLELDWAEPVTLLVNVAKAKLAEYFGKREREIASSLIDRWKEDKVYPYEGDPKSESAKKAQQVFNVCAVAINEHTTGFDQQPNEQKALSFRLLREVIEVNPGAVTKILNGFAGLPKQKQQLLAELLERTTLSSIIDAVHQVDMRLATAKGLLALVCDKEISNSIKEREHIHRIVEDNPWLFSESFAQGLSESSLTNVLRAHLKLLGSNEKVLEPVLKGQGKNGRIDILLAKKVKRSGRDDDDHLVIELKRASKKLTLKELTQLEEYANAVMRDNRFNKTAVKWSFWLVGTELDEDLELKVNSADREPGCAHIYKEGRGYIWVKTWGQVVHDALGRLEYIRDRLNIAISEEDAVKVLKKVYPLFVPQME